MSYRTIFLISLFIILQLKPMEVIKEYWQEAPQWVKLTGAVTCVGSYILWDAYKHYKKDKQIKDIQTNMKKIALIENPTEFVRSLSKPVVEDAQKFYSDWKQECVEYNKLMIELTVLAQQAHARNCQPEPGWNVVVDENYKE